MSEKTIRVLHVEDDEMQRRYVSHHLKGLTGLRFDVRYAYGEDEAVKSFEQSGADLIVLDYHLLQGDGLRCLERLRECDQIVPVIAISGVAKADIAAALIQAGADDYIAKQDLDRDLLGRSVRDVLRRAQACRARINYDSSGLLEED
jgi:DNA-binding response OmpR family regulator